MHPFTLSLVATVLFAPVFAKEDGAPIIIHEGRRGQPSIYKCPSNQVPCFDESDSGKTWEDVRHSCLVEYNSGMNYCFIRLAEGCYAFDYMKDDECKPV